MKSVGANSNRAETLVALAISGNKCHLQSTLYQLTFLSHKIRVLKFSACLQIKILLFASYQCYHSLKTFLTGILAKTWCDMLVFRLLYIINFQLMLVRRNF